MIGFRDSMKPHAHEASVAGVPVRFGTDGVCWDPTPKQVAALQLYKSRFELVDSLVGKCPIDAEAVAGEDFVTAVR